MKSLLVVAQDRALTRFIAESLLQRSLDAFVPQSDDPWDVNRAHSAVEAMVLIAHRPPFDAIIVDFQLPDSTSLELVERIRQTEPGAEAPIVLITERGRDLHNRRVATERHRINGFLERPVTTETLRQGLRRLYRRRRVLLVEPDPARCERYAGKLARVGLDVDTCRDGQTTLDRLDTYQPDLVLAALALEDCGGIDLCAEIKRRTEQAAPVVLYGLLSSLPYQSVNENAFRADDFIQAPFDDGILVERTLAQIGVGGPIEPEAEERAFAEPSADLPTGDLAKERNTDPPTSPRGPPSRGLGSTVASPPPSASPAAVAPTKRLTRRVPCNISLRVREGDRVLESQTLDISHGGIFFELSDAPSVGSLVDLTFEIPNTGRTVNAVGKVAWVGSTGVGVKFSRIDKLDLQVIVDYVNRVSRVLYSPS